MPEWIIRVNIILQIIENRGQTFQFQIKIWLKFRLAVGGLSSDVSYPPAGPQFPPSVPSCCQASGINVRRERRGDRARADISCTSAPQFANKMFKRVKPLRQTPSRLLSSHQHNLADIASRQVLGLYALSQMTGDFLYLYRRPGEWTMKSPGKIPLPRVRSF